MKLFNIMDTAFENFDSTVRTYLSKTFNALGIQYSHNQIFGVIFDGIKGVMQNAMFYIEDALTEQNVFLASRKKSIYSLAKISGYEPHYGSSATGILLAKSKINNGLSSISTKLYIPNYTEVINKTTGLSYLIMLASNKYVIDLSAPLKNNQFKIVQGSIAKYNYIATGEPLETISVDITGLFDKDYIKVYINGELWSQVTSLYDMSNDSKEYVLTVGYENTFDITFGNSIYGKIPDSGSTVSVELISHSGSSGNIKTTDTVNFIFNGNGYDGYGNSLDLNNYITLTPSNVISGGTDSDSIDFVRKMIGANSRSNVIASEDNFKLFFKRFSFIGHTNIWSENNSMTVTAVCTSNVINNIIEPSDYYNISNKDLLLSEDQKTMVINTLSNSNKAFAGLMLKFQDPIIRRYSILCYIKTDDIYNKPTIKQNILDVLANYFINLPENTQFIPKSDLISAVLNYDSTITSFDINIISDLAEQTYKIGYYYNYELKMVNETYQYVPKQIFYEKESTPGLDNYGNIQLSSKLEIPMLGGSFKYYPNKADNDKTTDITMEPVQFFFI